MLRFSNSTSARVALNCNSMLLALKCHSFRIAAFLIGSLSWTYFCTTRADVELCDIQNRIPSSLMYCPITDMHHFRTPFSAPHVNVGVLFDNSLTV